MKRRAAAFVILLFSTIILFAQNSEVPQQLINRQTSLFEEYHKNKDYVTSLKYGVWLAKNAPTFRKTLWDKLSTAFSEVAAAQTDEGLKSAYIDSVIWTLNLGIQYRPDRSKIFMLSKGYNYETFKNNPDSALSAYRQAFVLGYDDIHYTYIVKAARILSAQQKISEAIDVLSSAKDYYDSKNDSEGSSAIVAELNGIASPEQLIEVNTKTLAIEKDPLKREKLLWQNLKIYDQQLKDDANAFEAGKELAKINPTAEVYRALGKSSINLGKNGDAIEYFGKAAKLAESKDDYLNIGMAYVSMGKGAQARDYARKALSLDNKSGKAYILIGEAYGAAVESCVNGKGGWAKMDFKDKLMYVLAVEYFNRAKAIDAMVTVEARNRIATIESSNLLPGKQDYFFQQKKSGDKIKLDSGCYSWVGETVTVP